MVLANEEGTVFDVLRKLTARGLGGAMGGGSQRVSWIHMEDLLRAVEFVVDDPFLDGTINVTAPDFPTNREWMRIFRESVGMPVGLPAARWMLEIGARLMRTETELVLKSRWAESAAAAGRRLPLALEPGGGRGGGSPGKARACRGFSGRRPGAASGAKVWLPAATR